MKGPVCVVAASLTLAVVVGQTAPLDSESAAVYLNTEFTGRGSGNGVTMRQLEKWELFCGTDCYKGHPDCTMSAEFFNHEVGMFESKFHGAFLFGGLAGVVFNSELVEKELARCYYDIDGQTYGRYNGGCGCPVPRSEESCSSPHSPFRNVAPDGTFVNGDSPWATNCMCNSTQGDLCFWRGPAYNTSQGRFGKSELPKMVDQYKSSTGATKRMQGNEVVLDSRRLQEILQSDPASAIVAVFYYAPFHLTFIKDRADQEKRNLLVAQGIQSSLRSKYGIQLPIVSVNQSMVLTPGTGPFFAHVAAALRPMSSRSSLVSVVV